VRTSNKGVGHIQFHIHLLCSLRIRNRTGCLGTQPNYTERIADGPPFRKVILDGNVFLARIIAGNAHRSYDLLYGNLVDEVLETESVWILKLEFVVID
jgi:hypothetical protein